MIDLIPMITKTLKLSGRDLFTNQKLLSMENHVNQINQRLI